MGREVVRQESPKNPGARSRLFFHKDVREVLEEDIGTCRVEAIVLDFPKGDDIIYLDPMAFKNLKRLRLFICRNAQFSEELNSLPDGIIVLDWSSCPLQSMPSTFRGDKLSILRMSGSRIQEIHSEYFKNLTVMKLWFCEFITKLSDISSCPNLKEIDLDFCKNLVEVHDSVGFLDNLVELRIRACDKLKSFPRRLQLRSLQDLELSGCSSLQNFPEIECEMKHLRILGLEGTAIEELPSSIGYLTGILYLGLSSCVNLKRMPSSIYQLRSHCIIQLSFCPNLISFGMEEEEVHNGLYASLGNPGPSGAGGVIRDHKGDMLLGFSIFTGTQSNNAAEFMGLLQGLRIVRFLRIQNVEIEMDSMLVLEWLRKKRCGLWYLEDYWEELMKLLDGLVFRYRHIYRECNSLADGFARLGGSGVSKVWKHVSEFPSYLRGLFRLDKGGCFSIRL